VAFVDDEEVPGEVRGTFWGAAGSEELFEYVFLAEVVTGGDDAAEGAPRVGVHAESAAECVRFGAIDEIEREGEFVPHFVTPLQSKCGRGEDEDSLEAATEQQFGEDQSGFDGFAESHVVGDEQTDAGHAECFEQRDELEVIDLDGTVEGAGDGQATERTGAVGVEEGSGSGPACGAEECVIIFGGHGAAAADVGECGGFEELSGGFEFPDETFFAGVVFVFVFDVYEMQASGGSIEGFDTGGESASIADCGEHTDTGNHDETLSASGQRESLRFGLSSG
jgi:hypothetical protein